MRVPSPWLARRCGGRCRSARALAALFLGPALTLAAVYWYKSTGTDSASLAEGAAPRCPAVEGLLALALLLHAALDRLAVPHALCHRTLWGALREGSRLPAGLPVEFCLLEESLGNVSLQDLRGALRAAALALQRGDLTSSVPSVYSSAAAEVSYDWWSGTFQASLGPAKGLLRVFKKTRNADVPDDNFLIGKDWSSDVIGIKYLALPAGRWMALRRFFGQNQTTFPSWHLEAPFPSVKLHGHDFPAPRDGLEMLKHLYPHQWWSGTMPEVGCL